MNGVIYQEEQQLYSWIIVSVIVICLLSIVVPLLFGRIQDVVGLWIGAGAILFVFAAMWLFRKLIVQITTTHLIFGYPVWKVKLLLEGLQVQGVVEIPKMAGAGIHCWKGKTYYNAKVGKGVEVKSALFVVPVT